MGLGLPAVSSGFGRLGFQQVAMGFGCLGRSFRLVPCFRVGYHAVGDGRGPGCFRRSFGLASFALLLFCLLQRFACGVPPFCLVWCGLPSAGLVAWAHLVVRFRLLVSVSFGFVGSCLSAWFDSVWLVTVFGRC